MLASEKTVLSYPANERDRFGGRALQQDGDGQGGTDAERKVAACMAGSKLRALGVRDVLISGDYYLPDTKTVPDELPGRGPLGGIYSCLRAAANDRFLILSVDIPLVPPSALYHLCQAHKGGVTVLRHGNFQEPLLGVYDCKAANAAYDLLTVGGALYDPWNQE